MKIHACFVGTMILFGSMFFSAKAQKKSSTCVLMGNSIFEGWSVIDPEFFTTHHLINKGISGETTKQMLARFDRDVINLKPASVVLLGGTNDIAGNGGATTVPTIFNQLLAMVQQAKQHGIRVYIGAVLPVTRYKWAPAVRPAKSILALNKMLKSMAISEQITYVDFYTPMVNENLGLKSSYTQDGVHPNTKGYAIMKQVLEDAFSKK